MKSVKYLISSVVLLVGFAAQGTLDATVVSTKQVNAKSLIEMRVMNKFKERISSARASVFLLDGQGKVVAHSVKWIIDARSDKGLKSDETLNYTFVLNNEKPFTTAKVSITRVVLESGKVLTPAPEPPTSPTPSP